MSKQIVVPQLGESVTEATIIRWHKQPGDPVRIGDILLEMETEKVNLEVGAESSGVLERIERGAGQEVKVGEVIGWLAEGSQAVKAEDDETAPSSAPEPGPVQAPTHGAAPGEGIKPRDSEPPPAPPLTQPTPPPSAPPSVFAEELRPHRRVRMSRRRQTIAHRLLEAQRSAAMLTTFNEVDMSEVMALRERRKEEFAKRHGVMLGIVSFFVRAAVSALRRFPEVNAEIHGDEIVMKDYYDISIAMDAEGGLVVPVLRDADRMSMARIETAIADLSRKAREGTLSLEDLRGGCFTITNGGVFGSLMSTPILDRKSVV